MSTKRERDEIKLEKAHLKEHKAIADRINHLENAVGILTERLDEIAQDKECRPKSDIKFDVIVKSKKIDAKTNEEFWQVAKRLLSICGQDLSAIIMAATKEPNVEVEIRRSN